MESKAAELYIGTGVISDPVTRAGSWQHTPGSSLSSRAEDVLVAVAVLGLVATVADGQADYREIKEFTRSFQQEFVLTKKEAARIIAVALKQMRTNPPEDIIDCPCATLNEHLDVSQKMRLFDGLAEVLVADGVVHNNEEHFLDYIAMKLNLLEALKAKFPVDQDAVVKEALVRWS